MRNVGAGVDPRPWIVGGLGLWVVGMSILDLTIVVPSSRVDVATESGVWELQDESNCSDAHGSFDGAYPGARNFGACNRGGAVPGTSIITVTNTSNNVATVGSFPWALVQACPKVIVFEIGGEFDMYQQLDSGLTAGQVCDGITIAGETAPAPGVAITNAIFWPRHSNWIMSHVYVMAGDDQVTWTDVTGNDRDVIRGDLNSSQENWFIQNVALMYATDETTSCFPDDWEFNSDWGFHNTVIGPALANSIHPQGRHNFNFLTINRCGPMGFVRTVFLHGDSRNPKIQSAENWHSNTIVYNHAFAPLELDAYFGLGDGFGNHTGANGATVLEDTDQAARWTADQMIGWYVINLTDDISSTVTDNTTTTVTTAGNINWDTNDAFRIHPINKANMTGSFVVLGVDQLGASSMTIKNNGPGDTVAWIWERDNALWDVGAQERDCDTPVNNCIDAAFGTSDLVTLRTAVIPEAKPTGVVHEPMPDTDAGQIALAQKIINHAGPRPATRATTFTNFHNGINDIIDRMEASGVYDNWCDSPADCYGWPDDDPDWVNGNTHDLSSNLDVCGPIPDDLGGANDKDDIMTSGYTRLHEWLICKQDLVMPSGWREYGLMEFD